MEDAGCSSELLRELYYSGKSITKIGKEFNVSPYWINKWLKESKIEERGPLFTLNQNFFDCIDTEEKAYWLGFIWCDGYVGSKEKTNGKIEYWFELALNIFDKYHIEKFNQALQSTYEVKEYDATSSKSKNKVRACLRIFNQYFCRSLKDRFGFIPFRIKIDKLIKSVPEHLLKHFIRGLIDSNGNVSPHYDKHNKKEDIIIGMSSRSADLLDFYQSKLIDRNLMNTKKAVRNEKSGDCYHVNISGVVQCLAILDYLYKDATIYLDRKFEKYKECIELFERRHMYFKCNRVGQKRVEVPIF